MVRTTKAGLDATTIVAAGAALADEVGFTQLTMGQIARRLGVQTPSLYRHIVNQDDLNRKIATLAANEAADAVGTAIQGYAGRDALTAGIHALRDYVLSHPGRYAATNGTEPLGPDDPLFTARERMEASFAAILRGYRIEPENLVHAMRTVRSLFHGFASIEAEHGFRRPTDVEESFEWMIALVDRGLRNPQ
jgi:AcrR family transcriptional regulator